MSKVISGDQLKECLRWEKPDVSITTASAGVTGTSLTTAKKIENIQEQAYKEGFAKGEKDGKQAGEAAYKAKTQLIQQTLNELANPLKELDDELIEQVVELVMTVARHMIRREINVDPGEIVAVVREGLSQLPVASRNIKIIMNPEDSVLVKDLISTTDSNSSISIVEDPATLRGGCRFITESSQIDATIESRLTAIAAKIMGGDREGDESGS